MDEDLERIAFVANLGTVPPLESVSIFISTSSELQTLPSGAVRVLLPAVCVPRVPQPSLDNASSFPSLQLRMYEQCGTGLRGCGTGRGEAACCCCCRGSMGWDGMVWNRIGYKGTEQHRMEYKRME